MHRAPTRCALLAVALSVGLVAGCGGGTDDGSGAPREDRSAAVPADVPTARGTVVMKDVEFLPARLTVKVGEKVTWRNAESLDHNVVAQKGAGFRSRAFGQGATYTYTAKKPGTIDYVCTLHPGMDGQLVVKG